VDRSARLKDHLLAQADRFVAEWFPKGLRVGEEWVIGNLKGEPGKSLKINLISGIWSDFATGESGPCLVSLYAARERIPYSEAKSRLESHDSSSSKKRSAPLRAAWPVPANAPELPFKVDQASPLKPGGRITNIWTFRNSAQEVLGYTIRIDRPNNNGGTTKDILPIHYFHTEDGSGWKIKGHGHVRDPIYGLDRLANAPTKPVLLVEGEKTADAAANLCADYVAISWMGGANRMGNVDWSALAGRSVTYWPDADDAGERTTEVAKDRLKSAGVAELRIVQLPFGLPKGWDLADVIPPDIDVRERLAGAEAVDLNAVQPLQSLNIDGLAERLLFNAKTLQFVDPVTGLRLDKQQLGGLFGHSIPNASQRLLADERVRKAVGYTYRPGQQEVIVADAQGTARINIWRPGSVEPRAGDASLFVEHLRYLCTTGEEFSTLCAWLAHLVQRPGLKIMFAVVLVGLQGTGKTALAQILELILGQSNVGVVSTSEIKADFNEWLEARQLVVVEEIMAMGRREVMNNLKPLITQRHITINVKYQRPYEIENAANFLFLSNSADALRLENGDRRYFVISSEAEPRPPEYYEALFGWVTANAGIFLHWLQNYDLRNFNPNKPPPMTEGKRRMIEASLPPLDSVLSELIATRSPPFATDLVDVQEVVRQLSALGSAAAGIPLNLHSLQEALRRRGVHRFGQLKGRVDGRDERRSIWAVRDIQRYLDMPRSEVLRTYFESLRAANESPF